MARKTYTKEFKVGAVKLVVEQGMKVSHAAKDLGVSQYLLGKWVRQFREEGSGAFPGQGKLQPKDDELRKLQKELHRTRMERDILKKAIAYFAKHEE